MEETNKMEETTKKEEQTSTQKIGIYLWIWLLLFVLSFFSYMVDWYQFQGMLRWSLILFFMFLGVNFHSNFEDEITVNKNLYNLW